jgi:hypothetical protein
MAMRRPLASGSAGRFRKECRFDSGAHDNPRNRLVSVLVSGKCRWYRVGIGSEAVGMGMAQLSDRNCQTAKPHERVVKLSDGDGLQLWIMPTGAKLWRLAYRYDGYWLLPFLKQTIDCRYDSHLQQVAPKSQITMTFRIDGRSVVHRKM